MSTLPVIQPPSDPRSSKTTKWRVSVLVGIHLLIALHITHWLVTGSSVTPVEPSEAMAFSRAGVINAGLIFFCVTIVLTAVFGRLFCGWACHLVALQDLSRWILLKLGIRPQPLRSRLLKAVPFIAFVYMFLWPVGYRVWIGDSFASSQLEMTTEHFWGTFPGWIIGGLTFLICGSVIVYFLGAKGFCTYACPYGAAFSLADRLAPLRIRVTDACQGCGHCTASCTSNVRVHEEVRKFGMVVDDGCMKCLDCVSICPNDALYYGLGRSRIKAKGAAGPWTRKPVLTWPEEFVLGLGFVGAFLTFRGLYGMVPFLMALGWSAVLAFLTLTTFRLVVRYHLSLRGLRLKNRGRLLPAGILYVSAMAFMIAFWIHSGIVRAHQFLGERSYAQTALLRRQGLDVTEEPPSLGETDLKNIRQSQRRLEWTQQWGLFPTLGNSSRLARLYFLSGSPVDLSLAANKAIARGEYVADMNHLLALEALRANDVPRAINRFEQAIAADPGDPRFRLNLGLLFVSAGDLTSADRVFDDALTQIADSSQLAYNSGLVNAYLGRSLDAIDRFQQAVDLDPTNLAARENLAGMLASAGRYDESEAAYRVALQQSPDDAQTFFLLARVLAAKSDVPGALAALEQSLRLEPGHQEAIILRASLETQRIE